MSYPLIQNPAPLQQLAEVINAWRQRRFEERIARDEQRRRDMYLTLATKQQFQQAAHESEQERLNAIREERERKAGELRQAQFFENQRLNREATMRAIQESKRQAALDIIANQPPGFDVDLSRAYREAAGNRYLPGTSPVPASLAQSRAAARAAAISGRQGSTIRAPVPGTSDGVTYTPPTLNYNAPSGTGRVSIADRGALAALRSSFRMIDLMDNAVASDPNADTEPALAALAEGLGNLGAGIGLDRYGHRIAQGLRSPSQSRFNTPEVLLSHLYPQYQAHVRNGPQFVEMMRTALGGMGTSVDPSVRLEKRQTVRALLNEAWRDIMGTEPPEPGQMLQGGEVPSAVAPLGVPGPGPAPQQRRTIFIDPRFAPRRRE